MSKSTQQRTMRATARDHATRKSEVGLPLRRTWPISLCVGLALGSIVFSGDALAGGPTGGVVVGGSGTITQSGNSTVINQASQKLALNWQTFNLKADESVLFNQPGRSAVALNRILDQNPSQIFGKISSNGQVFLINTHGIIFGATAQMNVGGLLASTLDLTPNDFLSGRYNLNVAGASAGIVNHGLIQAASGGSVSLVAGSVLNDGLIFANYGKINLDGAEHATLDFDGNGLINIQITGELKDRLDAKEAAVTNKGTLSAEDGTVVLQASATKDLFTNLVNNAGVIDASGISTDGGVVRLVGNGGNVVNSGSINVSGVHGGSAQLLSDQDVMVTVGSNIDASGQQGGGSVRIGGGIQGGEGLFVANRAYVADGATVNADATDSGNGGSIAVFSQNNSIVGGVLSARGGINGGNGGFVETSSHGGLTVTGAPLVMARADGGLGGEWLIDPNNIDIVAGGGNTNINASSPFATSGDAASLGVDLIVAALTGGANVTVTTAAAGANNQLGNITLDADLDYNGKGTNALTFNAAHDITINNKIYDSTAGGDQLNLTLNAGNNISIANDISLGGGTATLAATSGNISQTAGTLSAGTVNATAATGIDLTTAATLLNVVNNGATGNINITEADGVTVQALQQTNAANATGTISLSSTTGDIGINDGSVLAQGGLITLTASAGAITDADLGTAASITNGAGHATLNAATGIGSANAIDTQVATLAFTNTGAGGVAVNDADAVSVSGDGGSGLVKLSNATGDLTIGGDVISSGNVSLTATDGNIVHSAGTISGGTVTLTAAGINGSIGAAGAVLTDVNNIDFSAKGTGAVNITEATGAVANGTAGSGSVLLTSTTGDMDVAAAGIKTAGGEVTLRTLTDGARVTVNGAGTIDTTNGGAVATGADVNINSDNANIDGTINAGTGGTAAIWQYTSGKTISVGDLGTSQLQIENAELNNITASTIKIGNASSGDLNVAGVVNPTHATTLSLNTGGAISQSAGSVITVDTLSGSSTGATVLDQANAITNLGDFTAGSFNLTNAQSLTVAAGKTVAADTSTQLTTTAGDLTIDGTLTGTAINLTGFTGVTLAGNVSAGDTLTLDSTDAAITQSAGALTAGGTTTVNAGTGAITLNNANQLTGAVSLNGANTSLTNDRATVLGTSAVTGTLAVSSNGALSQTGALTVTGLATFTQNNGTAGTTQDIDLGTQLNDFQAGTTFAGTINSLSLKNIDANPGTLTLPGSVTGNFTLNYTSAALTLPVLGVGGNLDATASDGITINGDVTTGGSQTYHSAVLLGSDVTLATTNSAVSFADTVDNATATAHALTVNAGNGAVTFTGVVGGSVATGALLGLTSSSGSFSGNALNIGSSGLSITTSAGNITQGGKFVVAGTSNFDAGNNAIMLADGNNDFVGAVSATGAGVSLTDTNDLSVAALTDNANGNVSLIAGGALSLPGSAIAAGSGNLTLAANGGVLSTGGTLSGNAVSLTGFNGVTLGGSVTSMDTLALASTNAEITQSAGALTAGGTTTVNAGTGAITLNNANQLTGAVSLNGANTSLTNDRATVLGTSAVTGTLAVSSNGALSQTGALTVTGLATFTQNNGTAGTTQDIDLGTQLNDFQAGTTFAGTINNLSLKNIDANPGALTLPGSVTGNFTLNYTSAALTLPVLGVGGNLDATASDGITINGDVTTGGAQTYHSAVMLSSDVTLATTNSAVSFAGTVDNAAATAHALTVNAGSGAVTFSAAVGGSNGALGALSVNSSGLTTFGSTVAAASVLTDGAGSTTLNGNVTTSGAQTYGDAVTLGTNATLASSGGGTIDFASTLDGVSNLIVNTSGLASFGGAVGSGAALNQLAVTSGTFSANALTVGAGGLTVTTSGGDIAQGGAFIVAGASSFNAGANAITLTSSGNMFTGVVNLTGGVTQITDQNALTLGALATDALTATSTGALNLGQGNVAGTLAATSNGGAITQTGALTVAGSSNLQAGSGGITLTSAGNHFAGAVTAAGHGVTLVDAGNLTIAALSGGLDGTVNLTAGGALMLPLSGIDTGTADLTLVANGGSIVTPGVLSGGNITLAGRDGLTLNSNLNTIGIASLTSSNGAINQTGGILDVATLTGSSSGSTTLNGANQIGTLGSFTAYGFALTNAQSLAVNGPVDGGASTALTTTAGDLAINGAVNGTTTTLTSASAISEGTGGVITAGTLSGSSVGSTALNEANQIGTLGNFTAANFALTNAQSLAVNGPVDGGASTALTTTTGDLAINGAVNGTTTTLTSAGAINEGAGGVITAGTLAGSSVGSTTLNGANQIGTLGGFAAANFALTNAQSLAVDGPLNGGASTALTTTAGDLAINGAVNGTTTTLTSAGAISEGAGGVITAGTLTGSSVGSTTLNGANQIGMLGSFTAANFALTNAQSLAVDGPLNGGASTALTTTTGDLAINGAVNGTTTTLTSAGTITEGGSGVVTADILSGSSVGNATLSGLNKIATVGSFTTANFSLTNAQALTVSGPLATTGGTGNISLTTNSGALNVTTDLTGGDVSLTSASDLILANDITATTAELTSNGAISQSSGVITAGTLNGSSVGNTTLNGANKIGTLGSFTAANFALTNGQALTVSGPLVTTGGTGNISLTTSSGALNVSTDLSGGGVSLTSASDLLLANNINANTIELASGGAITQSGGAITAGTLTGSSVGNTTLNGANKIGTLGSFMAANFALTNGQDLTVGGPLSTTGGTGNISLTTSSGALNVTTDLAGGDVSLTSASDLALANNINATTAELASGGAITQSGGVITVGTLTGSSVGNTTLSGANKIGTLGSFTAAGFALTNAQALAVSGPVNGGASTTLTTTGGDLAINGAVNGTTTTLTSAGAITEGAGGNITADLLVGNSVGNTTLDGNNHIKNLGGFTSDFSLTNGQTLTVVGPLDGGPSVKLTTTVGDLVINGTITGATTTLISAGSISEGAAGSITASTLTGSSVGNTALNGANKVGTLGSFTSANFALTNAQTLIVSGPLATTGGTGAINLITSSGALNITTDLAGGDVSLTSASDLALANNINATAAELASGGAITQSGGVITAGTLTGSSVGTSTLNGANKIATLGSFTAAGFALTNAQALAVSGPVSGGASTALTTTVGDLAINGAVNGTATTLTSAGAINEGASGVITAGTLTGNSVGNTTLNGANKVGTLGSFTAANFALTNAQALAVNGPVNGGASTALTTTSGDLAINGAVNGTTTTLTSAGTISEGASGVITAGTLTGSSAGSTILGRSNQVDALGAFTTGGDFSFNDAQTLTVNNAPSANGGAGNLSLTATGAASDLVLSSNLTGNTVSLNAGRNINQTSGVITAATLTGSVVGIATLNGANKIGTLGNFTAAGFALTNAQALAVNGPVNGGASTALTTTSGDLAINGAVAGTTTTLTSAGAITEGAGGIITATALTGSSVGSTTMSGANKIGALGNFTAAGFALSNAQALGVSGSVNGGASTNLTTTTGDLAINGAVNGTITTLKSAGAINEGGSGSITATTLTGQSSGATALNGANHIGTLGTFSAANFALTNAQALMVSGPISGGASTALTTTTGDLSINGAVNGTKTKLSSAGAITEGTGGVITAATLSGSAAGGATLGSSSGRINNMVDTLGNFASPAGFSMTNNKTLTLASVDGSTFTVNAGTSTSYLSVTNGDLFQLGTTPLYNGTGTWGATGRMGKGSAAIYVIGTGVQTIANVGMPPAYFYAVDSANKQLPLVGGFAINVPTAQGAGSAQNGNHGDSYIDPSVITANYRSYGIVPSGVRLPADQQSGCDPDQPDQEGCQEGDSVGMVRLMMNGRR
ncbi:filamentous hemagglutinin N-terminal domain-containing protein [Rhodanobacter sp. AS-Z3]|uniref:filamentous hemagglutinin N-terminal domain-containing protein n=1 Tax=Rhodanobacter sp. AS-Z3 TaxID=3031330 RepID=UPI00247A9241|nr:filamentous hemagglutinin N-terminal domain-containing protein [Rhodanobacter sp. AS-Z3]WEN14473.1 filamentous hemagglutinin N-terminal domain-containing protein [Rhodanobacter sp. AS-Z3]